MSRANVSRHGGDQWQARWFWLKAAKILDPSSSICGVAWEHGPKSVDDIVIDYKPPRAFVNGFVDRDYVQCKWHVAPGTYGYQKLTDPKFINATTTSWLQRAHAAYQATNGESVRFKLKTNSSIDSKDVLRKVTREEHGGIDIDKLFTGKTVKSETGAMRACWCDHLGVTEDDLRSFVKTLVFSNISKTLDELRESLNERLAYAQLRTESESQSTFKYDDLIIKMHQQGEVVFDEESFRAMCDRESLWADDKPTVRPYTVGIRSFMHRFDALEDRCDDMLDLVPDFDGRYLRDGLQWQGNIDRTVTTFLETVVPDHESLHVIVDAHASIATATGRALDVKSGRQIFVEQRVPNAGRQVWNSGDEDVGAPFVISVDDKPDTDVVVALSVTHDVTPGVDAFCVSNLPDSCRVDARPKSDPGGNSISGGSHAWQIALQLAKEIRALPGGAGRRIHLFAAAPNALLVFLGQQLGLGQMTVYEWDFEGNRGGGYKPALTLT